MSTPPVLNVGSGPIDPDPPPPPKALLDAVRHAVLVNEHLRVNGFDRWLVVDAGGWELVSSPVEGHARIDEWTLEQLRKARPIGDGPLVEIAGLGRFAVRPVLMHGGGRGGHVFVGLCPT